MTTNQSARGERLRVEPSLFPDLQYSVPQIPGLAYIPSFVDAERETRIVALVDAAPWDSTWARRRQLYGQSYGRRSLPIQPVPDWGLELARAVERAAGVTYQFDQMLVNEYLPGQGIALHRDYAPFDRTVASLSLLSTCVMALRHVTDRRRESVFLERRSLLVLSDEARYEWEHGIARRKNDRWNGVVIPRTRRISVTFRRMARGK